jgi:hypothetical protein
VTASEIPAIRHAENLQEENCSKEIECDELSHAIIINL